MSLQPTQREKKATRQAKSSLTWDTEICRKFVPDPTSKITLCFNCFHTREDHWKRDALHLNR